MTPERDKANFEDQARRWSVNWLKRSLLALLWCLFIASLIPVASILTTASQCAPVYGLTIGGDLFITDSLKCPDSSVEPIYQRQ